MMRPDSWSPRVSIAGLKRRLRPRGKEAPASGHVLPSAPRAILRASRLKRLGETPSSIPRNRMGFGYKTTWFAARSPDTDTVLRALRLRNPSPCQAGAGIHAACRWDGSGYSSHVFVTPSIDGWILCVGGGFFELVDGRPPRFGDVAARASAETGSEVQAHAWARAVDGTLRRAYSYVGESGEKILDVGAPFSDTPNIRSKCGRWSLNRSMIPTRCIALIMTNARST